MDLLAVPLPRYAPVRSLRLGLLFRGLQLLSLAALVALFVLFDTWWHGPTSPLGFRIFSFVVDALVLLQLPLVVTQFVALRCLGAASKLHRHAVWGARSDHRQELRAAVLCVLLAQEAFRGLLRDCEGDAGGTAATALLRSEDLVARLSDASAKAFGNGTLSVDDLEMLVAVAFGPMDLNGNCHVSRNDFLSGCAPGGMVGVCEMANLIASAEGIKLGLKNGCDSPAACHQDVEQQSSRGEFSTLGSEANVVTNPFDEVEEDELANVSERPAKGGCSEVSATVESSQFSPVFGRTPLTTPGTKAGRSPTTPGVKLDASPVSTPGVAFEKSSSHTADGLPADGSLTQVLRHIESLELRMMELQQIPASRPATPPPLGDTNVSGCDGEGADSHSPRAAAQDGELKQQPPKEESSAQTIRPVLQGLMSRIVGLESQGMYLERRIGALVGLELAKRIDQLVGKLAAVDLRSSNLERRVEELLEKRKPELRRSSGTHPGDHASFADVCEPQWRSLPVHVTPLDLGDQFPVATLVLDKETAFSGIGTIESSMQRNGQTRSRTPSKRSPTEAADDAMEETVAFQAPKQQPCFACRIRGPAEAERHGCCGDADLLNGNNDVGNVMCTDTSHGLATQSLVMSRPMVFPLSHFGQEQSAKVLPLSPATSPKVIDAPQAWPAMNRSSERGCFSL